MPESENLFGAFELSESESERLANLPFNPGEKGWMYFASMVHENLLAAYASGEIDLRTTLATMRSCSLGCELKQRVMLTALTVEKALKISPRTLNSRKPPYPTWLKQAAGTLVQMLKEQFPDKPTAPNESNDWTTDILDTAKAWLVALDLCPPELSSRTLYAWYKESTRQE